MAERPILFNGAMVRAILEGRKTQTRRIVKPQPDDEGHVTVGEIGTSRGVAYLRGDRGGQCLRVPCPYGQPGGRLFVRENGWERPGRTPKMMREGADTWAPYYFDADGYGHADAEHFKEWGFKRRPSIHMPRWASRITLEITGVRVERLNGISEADAIAEGIKAITKDGGLTIKYGVPDRDGLPGNDDDGWHWCNWMPDASLAYRQLWNQINGHDSWVKNPWVWVIEFRRV